MPTPEAVLEATRLLARGTGAEPGVGDLMVVDIGGATTDVHSDHAHEVAAPGIEDPLLPPPPTLRTVEGDLGLRAGAAGVLAADGRWIEAELGLGEAAIGQAVSHRSGNPEWIPAGAAGGPTRRSAGGRLRDPRRHPPQRHDAADPRRRRAADAGARRPRSARGDAGFRYRRGFCPSGGRRVDSARSSPAPSPALAGTPGPRRRRRRQLHPRRRRAACDAGSRRGPAADAAGSFTCPKTRQSDQYGLRTGAMPVVPMPDDLRKGTEGEDVQAAPKREPHAALLRRETCTVRGSAGRSSSMPPRTTRRMPWSWAGT